MPDVVANLSLSIRNALRAGFTALSWQLRKGRWRSGTLITHIVYDNLPGIAAYAAIPGLSTITAITTVPTEGVRFGVIPPST